MDGQQTTWIPYGLGEHMCAGRHIAKKKMMASVAVMLDRFRIELLTPTGWRPGDNVERLNPASEAEGSIPYQETA
jgi:cytochrome P450